MYIPNHLLLQWHITERCTNHCKHCYQDANLSKELPLQTLVDILDQYKNLLILWRKKSAPQKIGGHINVTGGEPFIRDDFPDLLQLLSADKPYYSFAILCNGTYIDQTMARFIRKLHPTFVQLSLEGSQPTHDAIRGKGDFDRTLLALQNLVREKITTFISFTAHRNNYTDFPEAVRIGRKIGVNRIWTDRLIPNGKGKNMEILSPEETKRFFQIVKQSQDDLKKRWFTRTEVKMHRALQFLISQGTPYFCSAGDSLITIQPNGDVYPCRRLPIRIGNLLEKPLENLYYESNILLELRDKNKKIEGCEPCIHKQVCRGGLRCLSYAVTGNPFTADPGCWIK